MGNDNTETQGAVGIINELVSGNNNGGGILNAFFDWHSITNSGSANSIFLKAARSTIECLDLVARSLFGVLNDSGPTPPPTPPPTRAPTPAPFDEEADEEKKY